MAKQQNNFIPTRGSLLARLKDWDDQQSWRDFFNTYWKLIYNVAIKSGLSDADAQDVVQETIVTVAKKIKGFKYDPALGSFKGWLRTITHSRIVDHVRRRQRAGKPATRSLADGRRTGTIERIPDPASLDHDAVWETEWQRNLLEAALDRLKHRLKPKQYQIFDLYAVKGWPVAKVVKTLGVSRTQVYLAKLRITPLLKKEIARLESELI
jgi:RNA polymerase sigma-70 factor (ECF subfamily)